MRNIKRYASYYDSGEEWLGELPVGWKLVKTKHLFKLITEPAPVGNNEQLLSVYTALGVRPRKELAERGNKASTTDNYWFVKKGDIIVNKLLAWMGAIGISNYDGVTSPAYDVLRAKDGVDPRYYNYLFRSPFVNREFKRHSRGIMDMRLRLYFNRFGDLKLPQPPINEQISIINFLDYKIGKADRFIYKKRQLVRLLEEKKIAVIERFITLGLTSNTEMKESRLEWQGSVPKHWRRMKIKYLVSKPVAGAWGADAKNDISDVTCIRVADFGEYGIKDSNLTIRNVEVKSDQLLSIGDLLIEKSGGGEKTPVGRVVMYTLDLRAITSNFICKVTPIFEKILPEYLLFVFKVLNKVRWNVRSVKQTTGIQNIDISDYLNNEIFMPDIAEQQLIIDRINTDFKIFDNTITKINNEIRLAEEYKHALVAATVTGRINVDKYKVHVAQTSEHAFGELDEDLMIAAEEESFEYED